MGHFTKSDQPTASTNSDFISVGSIIVPFENEYGTKLEPADAEGLRNLNCSLNLNFYFSDFMKKKYPEILEDGKLILKSKDRIRISFTPPKNAKDFVVGVASLKLKDDEFVDIGNLTVTKKSEEKDAGLTESFKTSGIKLTYQVWLPASVSSLEVKSRENHILNFRVFENDKDFVLGHVSAFK